MDSYPDMYKDYVREEYIAYVETMCPPIPNPDCCNAIWFSGLTSTGDAYEPHAERCQLQKGHTEQHKAIVNHGWNGRTLRWNYDWRKM
jgi:hypothetical protein